LARRIEAKKLATDIRLTSPEALVILNMEIAKMFAPFY